MLYVKDLLETKAFEGAYIIAGKNGLTNEINTVTIAEVPDAANWLTGQELVCTSGYFLKEKTDKEVTEWLVKIIKNASSLAIKVSRFIDEIPEFIISYANEHNFPIIGIKSEVSWPNIIETVIHWTNSYRKSNRLKDMRGKYTEAILLSNDTVEIVDTIYEDLKNPIFIFDGRLNEIAQSTKNVQEYGNLYSILIDVELKKQILLSEYYRKVVNESLINIGKFYITEIKKFIYFVPIIANKVVYGFLAVIGVEKDLNMIDYDVLDYLSNLLSIKFTNQTIQKEDYLEEQGSIQKLITNIKLKENRQEKYVVILFTSENDLVKSHKQNIIDLIEIYMSEFEYGYAYEDAILAVFLTIENSQIFNQEILYNSIQKLSVELRNIINSECFKISVGNIVNNNTEINKSYQEAKYAFDLTNEDQSEIVFYENLGVVRMLQKVTDNDFINDYIKAYLGLLLEIKEPNTAIMIDTLYQYLKHGGSISVVAKNLYIHPNTVSYRMKKVKELIGDPLRDADYRNSLLLALEMFKFKHKVNV